MKCILIFYTSRLRLWFIYSLHSRFPFSFFACLFFACTTEMLKGQVRFLFSRFMFLSMTVGHIKCYLLDQITWKSPHSIIHKFFFLRFPFNNKTLSTFTGKLIELIKKNSRDRMPICAIHFDHRNTNEPFRSLLKF